MFFKNKPLLVALLLTIIIGFSIMSTINMQSFVAHLSKSSLIEGMTDLDTDDDLPPCTNELAPTCSSTIQDTAASTTTNQDDENYILKTMIVPPVCPVCPSVINQHSHDGEVGSESNRLGGSEFLNTETNITNISNINNSNRTERNEVTELLPEDSALYDENDELREENRRLRNEASNGRQNNENKQRDTMLQQYENTINELRGQISNLQQSSSSSNTSSRERTVNGDGTCPPCPACERCPEPAFSCEKVINYRSPSVGQYLPMPVLGDFSTFKNN